MLKNRVELASSRGEKIRGRGEDFRTAENWRLIMAANGGMKWLSATVSLAITAISGTLVEPSLVARTNFNGKISN